MNDPRLPRLAYFLVFLFGVLRWMRVYALLPDRLATHFGFNNLPNGWQAKPTFFAFVVFVALLLALFAAFVPRLATRLDPENVNLPNKYFWLAPENSAATGRFLSIQIGWFSCGLLALLLYATSKIVNANLPEGRFDGTSFEISIFLFMAFTVLWSMLIFRHFSRLPG